MFRWFASSLAFKLRLTKNDFQLVDSRLSWRRNYAAKDSKFMSPYTKYKTVLAEAMCSEGSKVLAKGVKAINLIEGIRMATRVVSKSLRSRARMISNSEEIAQVATTSANGDREIGVLIAKAIEEVRNKEGHIFISIGKKSRIQLKFFYGIKLDGGYLSSCFSTNKKKKICVLNRPKIFIYEKKLSNFDVVGELLRLAAEDPILMFAEEFDNCVLDALIMRKLTTGTKVCAVELAPSRQFGESWNDLTELLAAATRAKVFREEDCMNFRYPSWMESKPASKSMLGFCRKAIVGKNDTVILMFHLDVEDIEELRAEEIKETEDRRSEELQLTSSSPRITDEDCLEGDIGDWLYAVLKVGGASRADVAEMKSTVTRALKAVKVAVKEGIVPGGGIAFLNASKELDKLQITNYDQKIGVQIIQDALKMPVLTIASSAGIEGSVVLCKLLEQDNPNLGYDATKGEYIDMIEHGIVDPLKVVRTTFVGATSMFLKKLCNGDLINYESELDKHKHNDDEYDYDAGTIQGKAI